VAGGFATAIGNVHRTLAEPSEAAAAVASASTHRAELVEARAAFDLEGDALPAHREASVWAQALVSALEPDVALVNGSRLLDLAARAEHLVDEMEFQFLFDRQRQLFSIGYRLADADGPAGLDPSYYDLLASEARLASFIAIAKGDVPDTHWFHLGRLLTDVQAHPRCSRGARRCSST
jgi:hypothetical protein